MGNIRKEWFIGFIDAEGNFQTSLTSKIFVSFKFTYK